MSYGSIAAYEKRIQKLESEKILLREKIAMRAKPRTPFEALLRTALNFLSNPLKLWHSDKLQDKKTVLKLTFAKRLVYVRDQGFRTAAPSLPFQLVKGLEDQSGSDSELDLVMAVDAVVSEPVSLQIPC